LNGTHLLAFMLTMSIYWWKHKYHKEKNRRC